MKNKKLVLFLLCSMIFISSFSQQFEEQAGIVLPGVMQGSTAWGDYDNDGYPDIIMSGWDGSSPVAKLYHNNGDNTFSLAGTTFTGVFLGSVAWGDYDNDNDLDILISGTTTGGTSGALTKIYRNNGAGSFSEISAGLPGVYYAAVSWCDYNRDGRMDILLTGMSDGAERICKLFQNNGGGNFAEVTGTPFTGVQYGAHAWGDFDNDGYSDLILSGENGAQERDARFYHNNGNGTFTEIINHPFQKAYYSSVACSDYNGDGLPDVLI
ncbi:MAG TPA: VCBS repeat-containing protein, partial [Bacteroidales bacterium]|nr:VCBS repeat-containing protein [Bacteroidales bacterium]